MEVLESLIWLHKTWKAVCPLRGSYESKSGATKVRFIHSFNKYLIVYCKVRHCFEQW